VFQDDFFNKSSQRGGLYHPMAQSLNEMVLSQNLSHTDLETRDLLAEAMSDTLDHSDGPHVINVPIQARVIASPSMSSSMTSDSLASSMISSLVGPLASQGRHVVAAPVVAFTDGVVIVNDDSKSTSYHHHFALPGANDDESS
jgi:hypothetical protein